MQTDMIASGDEAKIGKTPVNLCDVCVALHCACWIVNVCVYECRMF